MREEGEGEEVREGKGIDEKGRECCCCREIEEMESLVMLFDGDRDR